MVIPQVRNRIRLIPGIKPKLKTSTKPSRCLYRLPARLSISKDRSNSSGSLSILRIPNLTTTNPKSTSRFRRNLVAMMAIPPITRGKYRALTITSLVSKSKCANMRNVLLSHPSSMTIYNGRQCTTLGIVYRQLLPKQIGLRPHRRSLPKQV